MKLIWTAAAMLVAATAAQAAEKVRVTGEAIDTWCYFSGVMGGADAVQGTAHHTCALWCAAGGIPVGLLTEDGTVYMVLALGDDDNSAEGESFIKIASHVITAEGTTYTRDGVNYIVVNQVIADEGITNLTHEDYDVVPSFAIPKPKK